MFRIEEKADGSTTVYCRESGKLVCVVPPRKFPRNKPLGIGRPIPRRLSPDGASTSFSAQNATSLPRVSAQNFAVSSVVIPRTKNIFDDVDANTDYSEDCITNEQFMQTLGLISTDKLKKEPRDKLLLEFPYRNISKTDSKPFSVPPDLKLFDGADVCTLLGEKWFKLNHVYSKYKLKNEQAVLACVNKYAGFCKTSVSSPNNCANSIKLRCREEKLYPLTFRPLKNWGTGRHVYSFSRRQRFERIKTIETGLNWRGRWLLGKCKPLSIVLKRLSKKEIDKWTKPCRMKSSASDHKKIHVQAFFRKRIFGKAFISSLQQHPGLKPMIESTERYASLKARFQTPRILSATTCSKNNKMPKFSNVASRKCPFNCKVLLYNVLWTLMQTRDACYVSNTCIKVNDVTILPLQLWQPTSTPVKVHTFKNMVSVVPHHDHAYHRVSPMSVRRVTFCATKQELQTSSPCWSLSADAVKSDEKHPLTLMKNIPFHHTISSSCAKYPITTTTVNQDLTTSNEPQKYVPLIDITSDDEETCDKMTLDNNPVEFMYLFFCYGCSFKTTYQTQDEALSAVRKHLVEYHFVLQPEMFLEMHPSKIHQSVLIEAFPGFRTSDS